MSSHQRGPVMSMYLPNPDLHGSGLEAAEFIDVPAMADVAREPGNPMVRRPLDPGRNTGAQLDSQMRLAITRWAGTYISSLVERHNGNREDVRAVIHEL